ncbi:alpha/beta fold hydrolase [uncultured Robinsoniella sp.]|uniref:alpha/beta fold hydrolase n=1 Tax=uncultured Robinsoniella sp. TaxID=904190 RepID=UPI00290A75E1|nr:alpha/beta hydrolase [Clostridiales bacterium]
MSVKKDFYYLSDDQETKIHAVKWMPDGEVRAVLQIAHGMVEFIERYDEFAGYMADHGFLVVGNDHLGHGDSIKSKEYYGYFAKENGNRALIRDMHKLRCITEKEYAGLPYFILGHSMGSFLTRQYICCHGKGLAGTIIMGTGYKPRFAVKAGIVLTAILAKRHGWMYRSRLVDAMAFGGYNRNYKPARTDRDWLCRDEKVVDAYIAEEKCQFLFTLNAYHNLFHGLYKLTFEEYLERMPREMPVLFVAGEDDPVGDQGRGVKKVVETFRKTGMKDISCKLYPDDRHEILNELDRKQVYRDILQWLNRLI